MDKLVQRTVKAERQVARRLKAQSSKAYRGDLRQRVRSVKGAVADINANVANARRVRHESWEMGPVAPRRSVENGYGVASDQARTARSVADLLMRPFERERRCAWAGGSKYLNIAVGDRVVIMEGKDKGNIDVIESISISTGTVELKEFGKIVVKSPEWLAGRQVSAEQTYPEHNVGSLAIPISAVRLVHPLKDPVTGVTRDVIVRRLAHANVRRDRLTKAVEWDRYVVGLNVVLPWPEKPDPEAVQTEADTAREAVQDATFVPTLLRPPMPETLIHELRNRYSRFRTRHEPWYLEKKVAEARRERDEKRGAETMLTPQDEFNRKRRVERRSRGQPVLTEEALERIGAVMAKNQARA